ncbi:nucleotidyltransferase family protein [uncultured Parabacteroides sp.]|uniref:nucleotidyltransferase family protein n=1 Tax=uncultured Parabacteroides sp. TaxID=512312 RepID=UPI002611DECB|nr:nucleotidyltransferase family protein [uncultured Parabacteroides sp.]
MKTVAEYKEILSQFKKEFGPQFGIKELGIFGSVARGEQTENSDLDLFISLEKVEPFIIFDLKELLESLCKCKVDLVRLRDSLRPALKRNILKDGIYV